MKNLPTNHCTAYLPDELKACRKSISVSKKPTYIYTEEDLGEGILEIGL